MAGDWIKAEHALMTKPEVFRISKIVGQSRHEVVGRLLEVWAWADKNSVDGNQVQMSCEDLDVIAGCPGFAESMRIAEWLTGPDGALQFPNFQRHNGDPAKARALESEAKRLRRMSDNTTPKLSDICPTKKARIVRPEKRREEKSREEPLIPSEPKNWLDGQTEKKASWILRINALFGRKMTTAWETRELSKLSDIILRPDANEEIQEIEAYFATKDLYLRKDIITLLNNWSGELDRYRGKRSQGSKQQELPGSAPKINSIAQANDVIATCNKELMECFQYVGADENGPPHREVKKECLEKYRSLKARIQEVTNLKTNLK